MLSRHGGNLSGKEAHTELFRDLSQTQSSPLAEPLQTDPGLKREAGVREPISNFTKSASGDRLIHNLPPKSSNTRKSHRRRCKRFVC